MTKYEVTLKTKGQVILNEVGDSEDVEAWKIIAKTRGYQIEVKEIVEKFCIAKDYEQSSVGDASKPNISYELTDTNGESDYDTFYELRKAIAHAEKDKSVVLIDKIEWGNGTTDKTKKTTVWTREFKEGKI